MEFEPEAAQKPYNPRKLKEAYDTMADSMAKYMHGTLEKSEDRQTPNGSERRFTWEYQVDGTPWRGHARTLHYHGRLYTAMLTTPQKLAREDSEIERFLESLEMTEGK